MTSPSESIQQQVASLLQDRQQCATIGSVAHECQVSRTTAATVLEAVAQPSWQATLCQTEELSERHGDETIPCTGKLFSSDVLERLMVARCRTAGG